MFKARLAVLLMLAALALAGQAAAQNAPAPPQTPPSAGAGGQSLVPDPSKLPAAQNGTIVLDMRKAWNADWTPTRPSSRPATTCWAPSPGASRPWPTSFPPAACSTAGTIWTASPSATE
jgi:hypothetical protein